MTTRHALRDVSSKENDLMSRIESSADQAKDYLVSGQRRTKELFRQTEANTKKHPWKALGIAALVGFVIGKFRRFI